MKKIFYSVTAALLSIGLIAGCGSDTAAPGAGEKKVLTMGTSADFPPYEYIDTAKSNEIIGFDVDLAKLLASKVGYEVKVVDGDFSGLITSMQAGKVDFVMAGMEATEERKQNADFTDTYFRDDLVLIIKKDSSIKQVEDLKGKKMGVQVGSIQQSKAEELQKEISFTIETRDRYAELIQEVKANRIDAVIMENIVAKSFLKANADLGTIAIPNPETGGAAIAFPKGSELTEKFNTALKEVKENGELEQLIVKWFGDK